ncbi:MAG: hypothetical protein AMJ53_05505 [Gammaproteobacteria bacterium SG8_11]|nr:MAG: hypothetical protein AMJ53_05505 [Gammaproteobacteria bacterium SG8_11]
MSKSRTVTPHIQRYLIAGVLTAIPIWITWLVFEFFLRQLSNLGRPWVRAFSKVAEQYIPGAGSWLLAPWFESALAIIITIVFLYILGLVASRVVGKRAITAFDALISRIPFVTTVYKSTKNLISAVQKKPDKVQRVVLIPFPTPEMKTVGFVTRVLKDNDTGMELAAVYVPTTPNPTSGYLEIVPLTQVISTDWSIDEAMTFVISGGAVAPDNINYSKSVKVPLNDENP